MNHRQKGSSAQVNLLRAIHQCKRDENQTVESYANNFQAKLAAFLHQNNSRSSSDDQKWDLLLLQNDNLSADTLNALIFQLTTIDVMLQAAKLMIQAAKSHPSRESKPLWKK